MSLKIVFMAKKLVSSLIVALLFYSSYVNAVGFLTTDLFTSDGSSSSDAKTFLNRPLTMEINDQNIMVSCFDYSNTNCDETPTYEECFAANQQDFDKCKAYDSWLIGMGYTTDSTPATQLMNVSSAKATCVDARYYQNCDGSGGGNLYGVTQKQYYVFSQRKYDCDGGSPSWYNYDAEGYVSGTDYDYSSDISCPTYKKCSEDDDDSYVSTYDGTITNPCRTDDGSTSNYACNVNSDCWSNNCGGALTQRRWLCLADGDTEIIDQKKEWKNTCGGNGYLYLNWYDWLGEYADCTDIEYGGGTGYVCDSAHEGNVVTWPNSPATPCKKNIAQSCSVTSDCWNDDGGNWCNSISACTDGANGRACGTGTDCNSGYCSGGLCATGNVTDLTILEVIPIQVISNVDMVKGKSGYVRVIVHNNGPLNATGQVNITFDGSPLTPYNPANASKFILNGMNGSFDFSFKPDAAGNNKIISANVTIVN